MSLLVGVAEWLHTAGVGVYRPAGGYTAGEIAIVMRAFATEPDRQIVLATYGVDDSPNLPTDITGLQVRTRGTGADVLSGDAIAEAVYDELQGATHVNANGVHIDNCYRRSWTPLGFDDNHRPERSDNYHLTIARPTQHRTP